VPLYLYQSILFSNLAITSIPHKTQLTHSIITFSKDTSLHPTCTFCGHSDCSWTKGPSYNKKFCYKKDEKKLHVLQLIKSINNSTRLILYFD